MAFKPSSVQLFIALFLKIYYGIILLFCNIWFILPSSVRYRINIFDKKYFWPNLFDYAVGWSSAVEDPETFSYESSDHGRCWSKFHYELDYILESRQNNDVTNIKNKYIYL